jgi:hypothetical protein
VINGGIDPSRFKTSYQDLNQLINFSTMGMTYQTKTGKIRGKKHGEYVPPIKSCYDLKL